jgi:hypothetical protein
VDAGLLYVVSQSVNSTQTTFYQRLHVIELATGNEASGSPIVITATVPGTGAGGTTNRSDGGFGIFGHRIDLNRRGVTRDRVDCCSMSLTWRGYLWIVKFSLPWCRSSITAI